MRGIVSLVRNGFVTMADEEADVAFSTEDYELIEAAVMETVRGRWFLREFARRNRHADTKVVLDAVERLKEAVLDGRAMGRMKADLQHMASAIRQTKGEIRSFPHMDKMDPLNGLSDAEFQAAAEQRIRRMVQTLHYLEGRIGAMIAICEAEAGRERSSPETSPREDEGSAPAHPHPAFLM
jgi:hypothetical protein